MDEGFGTGLLYLPLRPSGICTMTHRGQTLGSLLLNSWILPSDTKKYSSYKVGWLEQEFAHNCTCTRSRAIQTCTYNTILSEDQ
jgi:hypothetical protein